MSKTTFIVSVLFLLIAGSIGLLFYLSYGIRTDAPTKVLLRDMDEEASIQWNEDGPVRITAESVPDFYAALGYTHGMNLPWAALLSRQAALGRLGEWFGTSAWTEDRLSKQLGFAKGAEHAYSALSDEHKNYLLRYADGMNAAFESSMVRSTAPVVLLEIDPEPWLPWHSIAIERLWGWLGVSTSEFDTDLPGVQDLVSADQALRSRLHIFGLSENVGLLVGGGTQLRHLFRYVTGDSGQPVFQLFSFSSNGESVVDGISIPGTFIIPAGRSQAGSWTYLLKGEATIRRDSLYKSDRGQVSYDRLVDYAGLEEVVRIENKDESLAIATPAPGDSSQTLLSWNGSTSNSDAAAWLDYWSSPVPSFSLLRPDGIVTDEVRTSTIVGTPGTAFRHSNGLLFATNSAAGPALVRRLQEIISGQSDTQSDWELMHDTYSAIAPDWNTYFLAAVDSVGTLTVRGDEALDYLRNWDLSYRGSSIAASVAETVNRELRSVGVDSLSYEMTQNALNRAVLSLTGQFGPDMRKWRWETIQELSLFYPGWKDESSYDDRRVRQFHDEFNPVTVAGNGHPSVLAWGPGINSHWRKASAAWEGLFGVQPGSIFEYERPIVRYTTFLGRFLAENHAKVSLELPGAESTSAPASGEKITQLVGAR